ncbi:MAG: Gfo/Idh/MocA family oxidoreductase [Planctomycetota bacterium]
MKKFGFGIIGCGMIADFHARAIAEIPNARLVAACSRSRENAQKVAEKRGAQWTTDLKDLLSRGDLDVVTICTPSGAHQEYALAAVRARKHVIVEKPLEITLERCDAIIEAARDAGVKLATVFPSRFSDSARTMFRAVDEQKFGRLSLCDAYVKWWRTQKYYDSGGWRGTWKLDGGGALMNQSIHAIDLLQWLAGPVQSVSANIATLCHERIEVEDTAVASLVFASGALGTIVGSTAAFPGHLKRIELSGDKGSAILEDEDIVCWKFETESLDDARIRKEFEAKRSSEGGGGAADPSTINYENHRRQFVDFLRAIELDAEPLVNGEEGRKSVEIILAIYRSSREGCRVDLPL